MNPHRADYGSLIFGMLFLGIAGWWLLAQVTDFAISIGVMGWLLAAGLVVVGVVGVLGALRSGPRSPDRP
ncbi:MAG: hypothetical protein ACRDT6_13760 [Micromonosporaceae bacterium]